jgi:hypothetical protein
VIISIRGFLAFIMLLFGIASFYWYQDYIEKNDASQLIFFPDAYFDFKKHTSSSQLSNGEEIQLFLEAMPIPALAPLNIKVKLKNLRVVDASIEFKGIDLPMGKNHISLKVQPDGSFIGNTLLPTALHPKMAWRTFVHLKTADNHFVAPFYFNLD